MVNDSHCGRRYDLIATEFDNDRNKALKEKKYLDLMLTLLPPRGTLLDVGCGMGEPIAAYFIQAEFTVLGIDASAALLEMAKQRFPSMTWLYGDMRTVELSEQYQGIIAYDSFFHLPVDDQVSMIKRFANWLYPHGILLVTTGPEKGEIIDAPMFDQLFSYYSLAPEDYRHHFNKNGLEVVVCEEDQPQHLTWILQRA